VTIDRGFVPAVSGNTLTIREATAKATFGTTSLTLPRGATVRNNGQSALLSQLRPGERVLTVEGPLRALVAARSTP
jgi:hypothetical protein